MVVRWSQNLFSNVICSTGRWKQQEVKSIPATNSLLNNASTDKWRCSRDNDNGRNMCTNIIFPLLCWISVADWLFVFTVWWARRQTIQPLKTTVDGHHVKKLILAFTWLFLCCFVVDAVVSITYSSVQPPDSVGPQKEAATFATLTRSIPTFTPQEISK